MSLSKLKSTAQLGTLNGCKVLCYGNSGTGKTRLIASAPAPIILSAEKGLLSLRQFNLPAWEIKTLADLVEAYNWLKSSAEARQFATVAVDSASDVAEVLLNAELRATTNGQRAYGQMADKLVGILRDFRDLDGKNVLFIAKQEYSADGVTGAKMFQPSFPGKQLSQQVPYFFDEVFQLHNFGKDEHGRESRWLRTQPDAQNQAKDRSGALEPWENADPATGGGLTTIFNKMIG